jgi:hypothetical protein
MAAGRKIVADMFARFLNITLDEESLGRLESIVAKIERNIREDLDCSTVQGENSLRVLLGTLLAYGWGMGMHPYHNPELDNEGKPVEVRTGKDILLPMKDLKAMRYLKKDKYGRVRKALFEPDQNAQVRSQIDKLLDDIAASKWQEEEF